MAKGTGIEIGATAVTVVEVDGSAKKFRVAAAGRASIEGAPQGDDRIKGVSQAARAALKAARASKDQIAVSIAACDVIIREIQLPFTDEEQIRKVIKFESEGHLHSCDIEDVVVGFQKIAESGPKSRVLVFAVKKDEIRNALDALDRIGVDPTNVTIDAAALFSAWRSVPAGAGDGTNVILDVGEITTTALVTVGDRIRMVRGIRLGTETITRSVASDLGVAPEEARQKSRQFAGTSSQVFALAGELEEQDPDAKASTTTLQRDIIRDSHSGFADRLANELRRSLSSVLLDGKLDGIYLTGSGSGAPGLEGALAAAFAVPVKKLDVLEGVDHRLPPELADVVAVPIGLGLKALGHDPLNLDFRQEEFKFARKFDRVKWVLTVALSLVLFLVVFLLIHEVLDGRDLARKQELVAEYARNMAHKQYLSLLSDPKLARIIDKTGQAPAEIEARLAGVPPQKAVFEVERLYREAAGVLERKYGYKPGEDSASIDQIAVSALVRLSQWLSCFKRPELVGKFSINRLYVSTSEVNWDMDLADEKDWVTLNECLQALPGVENVVRAAVKPLGAAGAPGMAFRMENNQVLWPREGR
jgi:type IV pilus assembly protein PilM